MGRLLGQPNNYSSALGRLSSDRMVKEDLANQLQREGERESIESKGGSYDKFRESLETGIVGSENTGEETPTPESPDPAPCPGGCLPEDQKEEFVKDDTSSEEETDPKTDGSGGSSEVDSDKPQNSDESRKTVSAVGQSAVKYWNKDIKPFLKEVDPKVYYGLGGGLALIILFKKI